MTASAGAFVVRVAGPEDVPALHELWMAQADRRDWSPAASPGGLLPELKTQYFRVGHMGVVTKRPDDLLRTVRAVGAALGESGHACDVEAAAAAAQEILG